MKRSALILSLLLFYLGSSSLLKSQDVLQQCINSKSQFAVTPTVAGSSFDFDLTGGNIIFDNQSDSIVVEWGGRRGIYTFGVKENAGNNCIGNWAYIDVELVGTPFMFEKAKQRIAEGDSIVVDFNDAMFVSHVWDSPDVIDNKIYTPGRYGIVVTDIYGCKSRDTLTVIAVPTD